MTDPIAFGEKLLDLLDETAMTSTYKPALLLALVDAAQAHPDGHVPVSAIAERVIELYWPQTVTYSDAGVLLQNQNRQAVIVKDLVAFRSRTGAATRMLGEGVRRHPGWPASGAARREVAGPVADPASAQATRPLHL